MSTKVKSKPIKEYEVFFTKSVRFRVRVKADCRKSAVDKITLAYHVKNPKDQYKVEFQDFDIEDVIKNKKNFKLRVVRSTDVI